MKIQFLIMLSLLAIITSCSKDPGPCGGQKTYYYLSEEDKAKIPYSGTDTLIFISDQGDTTTLVGQGKKTYYKTMTNNAGTVDCPKMENRNYENVELVFIEQKNNSQNLKIRIFPEVLFDDLILSSLDIYITNTLIIGRSFKYIDNKSFEDSVLVNSSYLKGVYLDSEKTILFNYSNGVLKYKDGNNFKWTLNQIK